MTGGIGSQQAPVVPRPWESRSDAATRRPVLPQILPGRNIECAPSCVPRNPLSRALTSLGRALSRTFAALSPTRARRAAASAAQDARTELVRVLNRLASGEASGATLAQDLRDLADARRHWARLDPQADSQFEQVVEEILDQHWPGEKGLNLLTALAQPAVAAAGRDLQHDGQGYADGTLWSLTATVARTVTDRAFDTIQHAFDEVLEAIDDGRLSTEIAERAEQAVATGAVIFAQLRRAHALDPAAPRDAWPVLRRQLEAEQAAKLLLSCLANCLQAHDATGADLDSLLQHLSSQSLQTLCPAPSGAPALDLNAAVEREIRERTGRLIGELDALIEKSESLNPVLGAQGHRLRSSTVVNNTFGGDMQRTEQLKQQILDHCAIFALATPEETLQGLLTTTAEGVSRVLGGSGAVRTDQLAKAHMAGSSMLDATTTNQLIASWRVRLAALEDKAAERLNQTLVSLSAGDAAAQLRACRQLVAGTHDYLKANGLEGTTTSDLTKRERLQEALTKMLERPECRQAFNESGPAMLAALKGPEMQTVMQVLYEAESQARQQQGLEALSAVVADTCVALQLIILALEGHLAANGVAHELSSSTPTGEPDLRAWLQPGALEELDRLFCIGVRPDGGIVLTQGLCARPFAQSMIETIEQPFSGVEQASVQMEGIEVPEQFYKDAERAGTDYFMNDGQPLIDRKGWKTLTKDERDQRVADGYKRLVAFYQNNEQQTRAIVQLAHQGLVAAFTIAMSMCPADSPVVLEGYGPGLLQPIDTNTTRLTHISFSTSKNHQPRLQLTYEARGGMLDLIGKDGLRSGQVVFLDKERSRARITVTVEAHAGENRISVIDTPLYDVSLVRSPIRRPFPLPTADDLNQGVIYKDLIAFAQKSAPSEVAALTAMHAILKVGGDINPVTAYQQAKAVYDRHVRAGAPEPLALDNADIAEVRESFENFERESQQLVQIFDEALAEAQDRIATLLPDRPKINLGAPGDLQQLCQELKARGGDSAQLAAFLTAHEALTRAQSPTMKDSQALLMAYFTVRPGERALFSEGVLQNAKNRMQRLVDLREECIRNALQPVFQALRPRAARLLPGFNEFLLIEGRSLEPVDIDTL